MIYQRKLYFEMAEHNDFGQEAENLAVDFLKNKGYKILARNYRYLKAEIDIIAEFDTQIVIVEVKARSTDSFINPEEAVNRKKVNLMISAANHFLEENDMDVDTRFDVITILSEKGKELKINHLPNAFEIIGI